VHIRLIQEGELNELLSLCSFLNASDDPLPNEATVREIWRELLTNPRYKYCSGFVDGSIVLEIARSCHRFQCDGGRPRC